MVQYSLCVLTVPLNPKQTDKQIHVLYVTFPLDFVKIGQVISANKQINTNENIASHPWQS